MFTSRNIFSPFVRRNEELLLLQIFRPLYLVLSVFGLIPCSINFPKRKVDRVTFQKFAFNHFSCALFILLIVSTFFGLHVFQVINSSEDNVLAEGTLSKVNYVIELSTAFIFCAATYFCAYQNQDIYISMLRDITKSWDDLQHLHKDTILGRLRVQVNCVVLGGVITFVTLTIITSLGTSSVWKRILIMFAFNIPETMQLIVVAFYYVLILIVSALLKNIVAHCNMYMKIRKFIKKSQVELVRNPIKLSQMQRMYLNAMCVKRQINDLFQAPILLILVQCFHTTVSESSNIYFGLLYKDFSVHTLIECAYWILLQMIKVSALARSGTLLKSEANRIGCTIHKIPIGKDEDIKLLVEIQHFTTLITYQDPEIRIFGYFPLEAPLMFHMVVEAGMYFVILVQFTQ